jgi:PhnB protein
MAKAKKAVPEGYSTVNLSLTVHDAAAAIDWYVKTLGAEERARSLGPDGKVMHSELRLGGSLLMVNDAVMGAKSPKDLGGSPANLYVYVENCDPLYDAAVKNGAKVEMPMGDMFWGDRCGSVVDPFGYRWTFATRKEDLTQAETEARANAWFAEQAAGGAGKPQS